MKELLRVAIRRALFYLGLDKNRTEEPPCSRLAASGGVRNEEFRSTSGDYPDVASSRLSEGRSTSPNREGRRTSLAQPPKKRPRNRAFRSEERRVGKECSFRW